MVRNHLLVTMLLALAVVPALTSAGTIDLTVGFSESQLSFSMHKGYDQVVMTGLDLLRDPGRPQLPVLLGRAIIPPGEVVQAVEILEVDQVDLPGSWDIYPAQPPQILSLSAEAVEKLEFMEPEEMVYRSRRQYPEEMVRVTGHGCLGGYHLVDLEIHPLRYLPAEKRLRFMRIQSRV